MDNWHPLGPLYAKYGDRVVCNLERSLAAKVSSIIVHNNWRWPRPRNRITQEIIEHAPADLLPHVEREDRVVWILTQNGEHFSRSSWDALRSPRVEVI